MASGVAPDRADQRPASPAATGHRMAGHAAVRKRDYVPRLSLFLQSSLLSVLGQFLVLGLARVWDSESKGVVSPHLFICDCHSFDCGHHALLSSTDSHPLVRFSSSSAFSAYSERVFFCAYASCHSSFRLARYASPRCRHSKEPPLDAMPALDIAVRQILVDYFDDDSDAAFHHRLLMIPSGKEDGVWIALTPDHEAVVLDLTKFERVTPLVRGADFPERCEQYGVYGFDPFEDDEWDECLRECRELAYVMGYLKRSGDNDVEGVRWRVADVTHPMFGEYIPDEAWADEELSVTREKCGLVKIDDVWVFMQMVVDDKFRLWQEEKFSTAIADPRVLPLGKSGGKRFKAELEAVGLWEPLPLERRREHPSRPGS